MLTINKLVCFTRTSVQAPQNQLSMTHAVIDLDTEKPEWINLLQSNYKVTSWPAYFLSSELTDLEHLISIQPKPQASLEERIKKLITMSDIVLFMKGEPANPQCGFSKRLIAILEKHVSRTDYKTFDILTD